jgi:WD40 repeat protein
MLIRHFLFCCLLVVPALVQFVGCDLKTPSPTFFPLPGEEVTRDLPFHSQYAFAIAWHPDGERLAVAERTGAVSTLAGLAVANSSIKSYKLSFRDPIRFSSIPRRRLVVGETPEGQLWAWSLENAKPEIWFEGPVQFRLWSLSQSGEELIYVPRRTISAETWQVHYVNLRNQEEATLVDSIQSVQDIEILPDGQGALILSARIVAGALQYHLAYHPLPSGQAQLLLQSLIRPARIAVSRDGKKFAFVRSTISGYDLMIFDLQEGPIDSLTSIRQPLSDLVWVKNDDWIAAFDLASSSVSELRAYELRSHNSVALAQHLPFGYFADFLLFALDDTLAFFMRSPERVSVFDRRNGSFTPWFAVENEESIESIAWDASGEKIFVHKENANGTATFCLITENAAEFYPKNYSCFSASLQPDGRRFWAIKNRVELLSDALAANDAAILRAKQNYDYVKVRVHPSGKFAGVVDRFLDRDAGVYLHTWRLMEISSYAIIDSLKLPGNDTVEFQWLPSTTHEDQFAAIWRARHRGGNALPGLIYYYLMPGKKWLTAIFRTGSASFSIVPPGERVSILEGNLLRTLQLSVPVEP